MRYLRLYRAFVINNISRAMEFRAQFAAGIIGYAIWTGVSLIFIQAVFGQVHAVRGWTKNEMWVLSGSFVILESACYGLLGPNMWRFAGNVRDGSLDIALTRPVNLQFLVSTRYMDPNGVCNAVVGLALMFFGFAHLGHWPGPLQTLLWFALLCCGFVIAYSMWFLCVTIAVWAVKLEGLAVIFDPLMQMARYPVEMYPRRLLLLFCTAFPIAFMTTYPARALLGKGDNWVILPAGGMAALMLFLSNRFFAFALKYYGSASS